MSDYVATLALLYDYHDYFAAMGATLTLRLEGDEVETIDVADLEPDTEDTGPRRYFRYTDGWLWLDYSANDGAVTKTDPWLTRAGEPSVDIETAGLDVEVLP